MIPLTNYDFQWARSELVIIYPDHIVNSWFYLSHDDPMISIHCFNHLVIPHEFPEAPDGIIIFPAFLLYKKQSRIKKPLQ